LEGGSFEILILIMIKFFKKYPEVLAVMSQKDDGSMRLFIDDELDNKYEKNRKKFFKKIGIEFGDVISAELVHKTGIKHISSNKQNIIPKTDALISKKKGIFISVTAADCIPVLFFDTKAKIIGIAHAGWRGVVEEIVEKAIKKIIRLGGNPKNIQVAMGPGINKCHFDIGKRIGKKFVPHKGLVEKRGDRYFIELKEIIRRQLAKSGIVEKNIEDKNECTFCNPRKYFSYRKEQDKNVGLMIILIGRIKGNL
jgi:polyphenol oxidase